MYLFLFELENNYFIAWGYVKYGQTCNFYWANIREVTIHQMAAQSQQTALVLNQTFSLQ